WNDTTANVTSVTDTNGNVYSLAVGPTRLGVQATQSIYFAPNIVGAAANGNSVVVSFSSPATFVDIRVLEYSGIDTVSPLHAVAASTGNSQTSTSGALNVTVPNVLLVAANTIETTTGSAGGGFTTRVLTSPNGDIVEDAVASTTGSYTANAQLNESGYWVMQMVAFQAAGATGDNTPPSVAITAPQAGASLTSIVNVTASASDNVAVAGVQFFLDGVPLGAEIIDPPYSTLWDTATVPVGTHVLSASARDNSGNTTTSL